MPLGLVVSARTLSVLSSELGVGEEHGSVVRVRLHFSNLT